MNRIVFSALVALTLSATVSAQSKAPPSGTVFHFSDTSPKWVTADIEFRDPRETDDAFWPRFAFGKPAGAGEFAFAPEGSAVKLRIECNTLAQRNGDQSRRVLGQLSDMPRIVLSINRLGKLTSEAAEGGKKKTVDYAPVEGTLEVADKRIDVKGKAKMQFRFDKKSGLFESVYLDMSFRTRAGDLGLTTGPPEIAIRAGVTGYVEKK